VAASVDMQMHEGRRKNNQVSCGNVVDAEDQWCSTSVWDVPRQFLERSESISQTDAYTAYDQIGGPKMIHAACGLIQNDGFSRRCS
jgi:hypothetical protein